MTFEERQFLSGLIASNLYLTDAIIGLVDAMPEGPKRDELILVLRKIADANQDAVLKFNSLPRG